MKIAFLMFTCLSGVATITTGSIFANLPTISNETPVSLTLGLVFMGVSATAIAAWRISRAWSQLENRLVILTEKVTSLEKSRRANISHKLRELENRLSEQENGQAPD